jgi:hypothetical protein
MMAIGPMFLAPLSETFGRRPVFLVALIGYSLTFIPSSILTIYSLWAVVRTISGLGASVVNTMVPGSITDLFNSSDTPRIMNIYILCLFAGQVSHHHSAGNFFVTPTVVRTGDCWMDRSEHGLSMGVGCKSHLPGLVSSSSSKG